MRVATQKKSPRRTVEVLVAGSNRGARENLPAFMEFNQASTSVALVPRFIDPVLGRAELMRATAIQAGVPAEAVEGTIERVVEGGTAPGTPIVLQLDRPEAIARTILAAENLSSPILGFILVRLPSNELWAVRLFLRAGDAEGRRLGVQFFARLGELTARRGSAAIIGEGGDPAHRAIEARLRRWFAKFTRENIGKLIAGIEPTCNSFEVTDDGTTTYALIINTRDSWSQPLELAESIAKDPPVPILRGESWVIGEVTPEGIRYLKVKRRLTDDKVALHGLGVLDNQSVDREHAVREAAAAAARGERQTISRRSPVLTTD